MKSAEAKLAVTLLSVLALLGGAATVRAAAAKDVASQAGPATATSILAAAGAVVPPAPVITAKPADPSNQGAATFAFSEPLSAGLPMAAVTFRCALDGAAYARCSSPASYGKLADGPHAFSVKAADAAGNLSSAASWSWTIDTVRPPQPVLTQQPSDPTAAATTIIAWNDADAGAGFQCSTENGAWQPCTSPYRYVVDTNSNQQHQFGVRAVDAAGNLSADTAVRWKVAEAPPVAFHITGRASGLTPGRWQPIAVTVSNPNSAAIYVSALTVAVSADSTPPGCSSATNLELQQASGLGSAPVAVPAIGSATVPAAQEPRIRLKDLPTVNQDACKGKAFTFTFTGTANN